MSNENALAKGEFHLLFPSQQFTGNIGQMQKASEEVIKVSPHPSDGQVYPLTGQRAACTCKKPQGAHKPGCDVWGQKVALTAATREQIGLACGISFHPSSGYTIDTPRRCAYKAIAMMKKPDGTIRVEPFEKCIDLDVLETVYQKQYQGQVFQAKKRYGQKGWNWPGDEEWVGAQVQKAILRKAQFIREMAQTGAKSRAYQHFIGMKPSYTRKELLLPFKAIRIDFSPDLSDPAVKMKLIEQGGMAVGQIFPEASPVSPQPAPSQSPPPGQEIQQDQDYEGLLEPDPIEPDPADVDPHMARILQLQGMGEKERKDILISEMKLASYDLAKDERGIGKLWQAGQQAEAILAIEALNQASARP